MSNFKFEWVKGIRGAWLVLIGKAWALHYSSPAQDEYSENEVGRQIILKPWRAMGRVRLFPRGI